MAVFEIVTLMEKAIGPGAAAAGAAAAGSAGFSVVPAGEQAAEPARAMAQSALSDVCMVRPRVDQDDSYASLQGGRRAGVRRERGNCGRVRVRVRGMPLR